MAWLEENNTLCRERFDVKSYHCTPRQEMSPSAILRWAGEIADLHLSQFGLSYNDLAARGVAFLLTAAELRIHRPPRLREQGTVATWHHGTRRVRWLREMEMLSDQGEKLVSGVSEWVLVDCRTHRILRPDAAPEIAQVPVTADRPDPGLLPALRLPTDLQAAGERPVCYTDLDYNGHLNNARYADILCDWLPGGLGEGRLASLRIDFQGEALPGDRLVLEGAADGSRRWLRGTHSRGKCFAAACEVTGEAADAAVSIK